MTNSTSTLILYEELVQTIPDLKRKGKTMPYTSINGHMFSFLDKENKVGLRLFEEDREVFIEKFNSKLMEQHGRIMKEYVTVPQALLDDTKVLSIYFKKSYEYVSSLKPKPTKKKK